MIRYEQIHAIDKLDLEAVRHPVCGGWTSPDRRQSHDGYIRITYKGRRTSAHRAVWQHIHGPVPEGMLVCHHCDQPDCYDPKHLFLGTDADNMADMVAKGRANSQIYGRRGRLTPFEVDDIRDGYATGLVTRAMLAELYDVDRRHLGRIINRTAYGTIRHPRLPR